MIRVLPVRQAYEYSCGAGCLASCLYYWDVWHGGEPELYPLIGTTEEGTSGSGIIHGARHYGLVAYQKKDLTLYDLTMYLQDGYTVILSMQVYSLENQHLLMKDIWEDGHYVVLVGIQQGRVIFMDPLMPVKYRVMGVDEFIDCWHDYSDSGDQEFYGGIIIHK